MTWHTVSSGIGVMAMGVAILFLTVLTSQDQEFIEHLAERSLRRKEWQFSDPELQELEEQQEIRRVRLLNFIIGIGGSSVFIVAGIGILTGFLRSAS